MSETEFTIGRHCGVTFAGLKIASLVSLARGEEDVIACLSRRFANKGFAFRLLREDEERLLVYICHRDRLEGYLFMPKVRAFLARFGYDYTSAEEIFTILKKLSENRLVIVVSHDYANAEKFADCILRLADGYLMTERQLEKSIEDNSSFKTKQKCGLKLKHRLLFALKTLKRKPLILTIAVILCAAAIVFGVFSQALYEFKIYEKVPASMEKNGIDLCTVKYSEKGYSDYDAEDFSYFDGETLNAIKELNADNELYSFANIGSRFFLIKGKRDIETLGFQLADYSEELTDDGVYITDTLAQERFLNNYYK